MEMLHTILREIGFTQLESEVFLLCQKHGFVSISALSRFLSIPRSTIHDVVHKMVAKSFLKSEKQSHGNMFFALTPDELIVILNKKRQQLQEYVKKVEIMKPALLNLQNNNSSIPKIKYYEGMDGLNLIIGKAIAGTQKSYFTDIDAYISLLGWDPKKIAIEFLQNQGFYREILIESNAAYEYIFEKRKKNKKNYEYRFCPAKEGISSSNCIIDDKYFHISLIGPPVIFEIHSETFCKAQQKLFDELWEKLGR